jgi:hypothetical protein
MEGELDEGASIEQDREDGKCWITTNPRTGDVSG